MNTQAKAQSIWRGMPDELLPAEGQRGLNDGLGKYEIVVDGPRNLEQRPFDYRNPLPLKSKEAIARELEDEGASGSGTSVRKWPIQDELSSFNYYVNDHAAIGVPDGPECALIDQHGTMRGYTGAVGFAIGEERHPPDMRCRVLEDGRLPIVQGTVSEGLLQYEMQYFALPAKQHRVPYPIENNRSYAWVGGTNPEANNLLLFQACDVHGPADEAGRANVFLSFAQPFALCAGAYYRHPAYCETFEGVSLHRVNDDCCVVTGSIEGRAYTIARIRTFGASVMRSEVLLDHWPRRLSLESGNAPEFGLELSLEWAPGQEGRRVFELVMPYFPMSVESDALLQEYHFDASKEQCRTLWNGRRAQGLQLRIPEKKVEDSFYQALNHLDLCSVELDESLFPTPGPTGGHHVFYPRDSVDLIYAYDIVGDSARAARMIDHFNLVEPGQETSAMLLWLLGKHLSITEDTEWARGTFYLVKRCMTWLVTTWMRSKEENGGLLPTTTLPDNELLKGHFVSYHLYAMGGAKSACKVAEQVGEHRLAAQWKAFEERFSAVVMERLQQLTEATGGVITPGFEGFEAEAAVVELIVGGRKEPTEVTGAFGEKGGVDWHNLCAVFPTEVLPPHHPMIESSLRRWRHMYLEGILPYPFMSNYARLHNYNSMNLSETWLRRGDHAEAVRDLYGLLLHTSSTHASGEVVESSARYDFNCTPHNWFSAKLVRFIRDALLYEDGQGQVHLLGGLSPAWMKPGMEIAAECAPTEYGAMSMSAVFTENGFLLRLAPSDSFRASHFVVHMPPFLNRWEAVGRGGDVTVEAHTCRVPIHVREVEFRWEPQVYPNISFERVVASYAADYERRVVALKE